jgi:putative membrane protein insertion efficiency factor
MSRSVSRPVRASTDSDGPGVVSAALLTTIAAYRAVVSPWLPARCRFHPTCSAYAAESIATHGALVGTRLAASRLVRCHPWHAGGYDPVPAVASRDGGTSAAGAATPPIATQSSAPTD